MYKAIIFDLDGVLIETEGIHLRAMAMAFSEHGCELANDDKKFIIGRHHTEYVPKLMKQHDWDVQKSESIINEFKKYYHEIWDAEITLKAGAKELFDYLVQSNVDLSLATNSSKDTVDKFLTKFGLENVFSHSTVSNEIQRTKPDPEVYLIAKSKLKLEDKDILAIEDSGVGLQAAKAAGLAVAVIPTEATKTHNFDAADYHFKTLLEIKELF
jgi:HAD superfamily hydrolase (TIGR01509 family)